MATIKDVARKAHVSVATVSRVLNKKSNVNAETRKLVEDAIVALNFKPNLLARSLFNKKSNLIGVIVPHLNCEYYSSLVQKIDDNLAHKGFKVILCTCGDDQEKAREYINFFMAYNVEGIIIVSPDESLNDLIEIPAVTIDGTLHGIPSVISNYPEVATIINDYICQNTLAPALILTSKHDRYSYVAMTNALTKQLTANNIIFNVEKLDTLNPDGKLISALIKQTPYKMIFAQSEIISLLTYRILKKYEYSMPKDIKLITYFDNLANNFVTPKISAINVDLDGIVTNSINLLLSSINEPDPAVENKVIDVQLIERDTTKVN